MGWHPQAVLGARGSSRNEKELPVGIKVQYQENAKGPEEAEILGMILNIQNLKGNQK